MNTTKIKRTIKGLGLASAVAFGVILFAGTNTNAQYGRGDRDNNVYQNQTRQSGDYNRNGSYDDRNNRNSGREIKAAYQRGYDEGVRAGVQNSRNQRRGNNGGYGNNNGYYGNGGQYSNRMQQAFQKGYEKGYREGLKRGRNNRGNGGIRWPF
ncbi:MAG: hypothetical protein ABJA02_10140 [Acidobacteriota bacterium]